MITVVRMIWMMKRVKDRILNQSKKYNSLRKINRKLKMIKKSLQRQCLSKVILKKKMRNKKYRVLAIKLSLKNFKISLKSRSRNSSKHTKKTKYLNSKSKASRNKFKASKNKSKTSGCRIKPFKRRNRLKRKNCRSQKHLKGAYSKA